MQRANPDEDMFEIIKEATGHRIEDQVYDKPLPNKPRSQPPVIVSSYIRFTQYLFNASESLNVLNSDVTIVVVV